MAWFIPYAAARAQAFFSPAYGETADSVPSPFALNYAAQTTTALRTELGARIERTFGIANGETLSLRARAAWAHDFGASPYMIAALQSIPSATFTVQGAAAARDSVLLSAGAELGFANGFALGGSFDSEFAENSQTYSGTGRLSYHW
jgi:outer membrane autotransporter protein